MSRRKLLAEITAVLSALHGSDGDTATLGGEPCNPNQLFLQRIVGNAVSASLASGSLLEVTGWHAVSSRPLPESCPRPAGCSGGTGPGSRSSGNARIPS